MVRFRPTPRDLVPGIGILLLTMIPSVGLADEAVDYRLYLACPAHGIRVNLWPLVVSSQTCPYRITDEEDLLGNPSMGIDPKAPSRVILSSLHGKDRDGPSERSRSGTPFVTLFSHDQGTSWFHNPYRPPKPLSSDAAGEHTQAIIDAWGYFYVGSLYASPGDASYEYTIVAQRFENSQQLVRKQNGTYNADYVKPVFEGNIIDEFWFVYGPHSPNVTLVWSERVPENSKSARADGPGDSSSSLAQGLGPNPEAPRTAQSVIGIATSGSGVKNLFEHIPREFIVGPCRDTTNPVLAHGYIYIGCLVDPDGGQYRWGPPPELGRIDMFRFDYETHHPEFLGAAPIRGGNPRLAAGSDGRLVLVSAMASSSSETNLMGVWGQASKIAARIDWGVARRYSSDVSDPRPGLRVIESSVQDIVLRDQSDVAHLVLKERFEPTSPSPLEQTFVAPASRYAKSLIAIHEGQGVLKILPFDIGNVQNQTFTPGVFTEQRNPHGVVNDMTDDLVLLPPKRHTFQGSSLGDHYQREFFAVADYGDVLFAEVVEVTNLRAAGSPPPEPPPVPLSAPAASLQLSTMLSAAAGTALVGLLVLRLALRRNQNPVAAAAKGEK